MIAAMDRALWIMALRLVAVHGTRAPYVTHAQIMTLRRELADEEAIAALMLVDDAVHRWVRLTPNASEHIH
jgi:hypothetical protein